MSEDQPLLKDLEAGKMSDAKKSIAAATTKRSSAVRVASLDVFRGLCVFVSLDLIHCLSSAMCS